MHEQNPQPDKISTAYKEAIKQGKKVLYMCDEGFRSTLYADYAVGRGEEESYILSGGMTKLLSDPKKSMLVLPILMKQYYLRVFPGMKTETLEDDIRNLQREGLIEDQNASPGYEILPMDIIQTDIRDQNLKRGKARKVDSEEIYNIILGKE